MAPSALCYGHHSLADSKREIVWRLYKTSTSCANGVFATLLNIKAEIFPSHAHKTAQMMRLRESSFP